jgi:hypothetical protein
VAEKGSWIPTFGGHSFERVGNHLCFSLDVEAITDFKSQKYDEAEGSKASMPEVYDDVAIDRQSEDSGSGAMGFPLLREMKKKILRSDEC